MMCLWRSRAFGVIARSRDSVFLRPCERPVNSVEQSRVRKQGVWTRSAPARERGPLEPVLGSNVQVSGPLGVTAPTGVFQFETFTCLDPPRMCALTIPPRRGSAPSETHPIAADD